MKWVTKERIGVAVLMVVLLGGWFRSYRANQDLKVEVDTLNQSVNDWMTYGRTRKEFLQHARTGSTLLYRMALSGSYEDVFEFIQPFPKESLICEIQELEKLPSAQLFVFRRDRVGPDHKLIVREDCGSVLVLVEPNSLEILDYALHRGTIEPYDIAFNGSANRPGYTLTGESPEFDKVQYNVDAAGVQQRN